jgi:hypothetical protein
MQKPKTRGDCVNGIRPCPWVSCRHHLYLEVDQVTGSIKTNTDIPPDGDEAEAVMNMPHTCSLDVADQGPHLLEEVAANLGLVRERARQIEASSLAQLAFFEAFRGLKNPVERPEAERFLRDGAWRDAASAGRVLRMDRSDVISRLEVITKRLDRSAA